jgi:hypothetical protein
MTRYIRQISQSLLVVLLALAVVGIGYGHRMNPGYPVDLTAYAMPDGTLPQLCLDGSAQDPIAKPPCPACTIVAAFLLPPATLPAPVLLAANMADWPMPIATAQAAHRPRAPPARGPPAVFLI